MRMKSGSLPRWQPGLERDAGRDLGCAGVLVLASAFAARHLAGLSHGYVLKAALLFAACAWMAWRALPASHPHARLGAANRITLARLGTASLLAALVGESARLAPAASWAVVAVATACALLDLADGAVARRSGLESAFGARFDMETDAWFTLVLSSLVLWFGKAGAWVLAAGLMRYAFVGAAHWWPWLTAPLPPSTRRKTVCVVQITALIVCLGPIVPRGVSSLIAAGGLLLLAWSFIRDIRWLARHRRAGDALS